LKLSRKSHSLHTRFHPESGFDEFTSTTKYFPRLIYLGSLPTGPLSNLTFELFYLLSKQGDNLRPMTFLINRCGLSDPHNPV
jgi:hypothetical protein